MTLQENCFSALAQLNQIAPAYKELIERKSMVVAPISYHINYFNTPCGLLANLVSYDGYTRSTHMTIRSWKEMTEYIKSITKRLSDYIDEQQ